MDSLPTPRSRRRTATLPRVGAALAATALVVGATLGVLWEAVAGPPAAADTSFTFRGEGWGHGVGMSQWGARNMASAGSSATAILGHYYQGTAVTSIAEANDLRVLLGTSGTFSLAAGGATTIDGVGGFGSGAVVNVSRSGSSIVLSGALNAVAGSMIVVRYEGTPLKISPPGNRFNRGVLFIALDGGGGLRAIVGGLTMNAYLRGLGEMPSSWPQQALRAQAIAGRSIAMGKAQRANRWAEDHDLKAWLDGAYIAYEKEYGSMGANWNTAVDATTGMVVTYGGAVASTVYSASSGGHTEHSEMVWVGSIPYLRGVPDSADLGGGNPHASWSVILSGSQLGAKLGIGSVTSLSVSGATGVSGRLDKATFTAVDANGATRSVSGAQMRSLLGLKSTKFRVSGATGGPNILPIGAFDSAFVHDRRTLVVGGRAGDANGPVLIRITDSINGSTTTRGAVGIDGHFLDAWSGASGTHSLCVTLFDNPTGQEVGLGCRDVVVK
jgi:SpoIID/LytB domain protein